jgi:hypothetical protein
VLQSHGSGLFDFPNPRPAVGCQRCTEPRLASELEPIIQSDKARMRASGCEDIAANLPQATLRSKIRSFEAS